MSIDNLSWGWTSFMSGGEDASFNQIWIAQAMITETGKWTCSRNLLGHLINGSIIKSKLSTLEGNIGKFAK